MSNAALVRRNSCLKPKGLTVKPDNEKMRLDLWILLLVVLVSATVARAVLVAVHKLPPTCDTCGRRYERRHLGERVCRCHA